MSYNINIIRKQQDMNLGKAPLLLGGLDSYRKTLYTLKLFDLCSPSNCYWIQGFWMANNKTNWTDK
jgi:hypothetical protein